MDNKTLKRDEVKYIRDLAKSGYKKEDKCYICGAKENLQFHHFYSISELWRKFKEENEIVIYTLQDMEHWRSIFKEQFSKELYEDVVTLCKHHHMNVLHKVFGQHPRLSTAEKQRRWCDKRKNKFEGKK